MWTQKPDRKPPDQFYIWFHFTQVLECFDMLYFGNRFAGYRYNIYLRQNLIKCEDEKIDHQVPDEARRGYSLSITLRYLSLGASFQHCCHQTTVGLIGWDK